MILNNAIEPGKNASAQESNSGLDAQRQCAAFEEIWRTHARQILRVTERITNNREDAEDALQDSFLRAFVYLHSFDGRSSLSTWLTRIAINSALRILRKRIATQQLSLDDDGTSATDLRFVSVEDGPSPEEQYSHAEQQAILRRRMRTLRPTVRRALELQAFEDRSLTETAGAMGLSIPATKSRIFHAKAGLRKSLEPTIGRRGRAVGRRQASQA
jgi:RNA polymerase sigma-70 factor, ECF subfamily